MANRFVQVSIICVWVHSGSETKHEEKKDTRSSQWIWVGILPWTWDPTWCIYRYHVISTCKETVNTMQTWADNKQKHEKI